MAEKSTLFLLLAAAAFAAGCQAAPAAGIARGELLYDNCQTCHGAAGEGNEVVGAPAIAGMSQWYLEAQLHKFKDGQRAYHPSDVAGLKMRPMARILATDEDIASVAAYVAGMPVPAVASTVEGGDASRGKAAFAACAACHGQDGAGNEALKAPSLKGLNDWYVVAQLKKFKSGERGAAPGDATGVQMRAIAGTMADEQAMKDLAAHISTLSR